MLQEPSFSVHLAVQQRQTWCGCTEAKIGLTFQIQNVIISIIISIRQSRCSLFVGSFVWNLNVFFCFCTLHWCLKSFWFCFNQSGIWFKRTGIKLYYFFSVTWVQLHSSPDLYFSYCSLASATTDQLCFLWIWNHSELPWSQSNFYWPFIHIHVDSRTKFHTFRTIVQYTRNKCSCNVSMIK